MTSTGSGLDRIIRILALYALLGVGVAVGAVVCGVVGAMPPGVAAGVAFGGLLMCGAFLRMLVRLHRRPTGQPAMPGDAPDSSGG